LKRKILITGAHGMVGRALQRELQKDKNSILLTPKRLELDYRNYLQVDRFFKKNKPQYVYILAAKVGGILANLKDQVGFYEENQIIAVNLFRAIKKYNVKKSLFLGSSCIYPRHSKQPIKESCLLTGGLEPTNEGYALAKISAIKLAEFYWKQFGVKIICPISCNIYGTNDNYNLQTSHVLSALIKRFYDGRNKNKILLWGSGKAKREFIHVSDVASGLVFLMKKYNSFLPINLGTGQDILIKKLAILISQKIGYKGKILWNYKMPDGMPRKILNISKLSNLGFKCKINLNNGIDKSIDEYKKLSK